MSSAQATFDRRDPVTGAVATTSIAMTPDQARAALDSSAPAALLGGLGGAPRWITVETQPGHYPI
jgi:hypothetical protein